MRSEEHRATSPPRLRANAENLFGFFESLVGWPRIQVTSDAICIRTFCEVPFPLLNSVLRARLSEANLDATVAGILARYRDCGWPVTWWVEPGAELDALPAALARNGLERASPTVAMSRDLGAPLDEWKGPPGFRIELVFDTGTARDWGNAFARAYGLPRAAAQAYIEGMVHFGFGPDTPFDHWVGYLDGTPVATASLFRCAGVAGVYNVATLPSVRGRGVARTLARAALAEARSEGFGLAVLQATDGGVALFRRLRFEEDGRIERYVDAGSVAESA